MKSNKKDATGIIAEVEETFYDDFACRDFLQSLRWEGAIICPHCANELPETAKLDIDNKEYRYYCGNCHRKFSPLTGTFLEHSKSAIATWFKLIVLPFLSIRQAAEALNISKTMVMAMRKKIKNVKGINKEIKDYITSTEAVN